MSVRQIDDLRKLFDDGHQNAETVFLHAVEGRLRHCSVRSVVWRYFLGTLRLPISSWAELTEREGEKYAKLRREHCPDPREIADGVDDLSISHPLSTHEASPWRDFFEDSELRTEVRDVHGRVHY